MLLHKIKLENIRSYKNEEVSFPKGSLMLSGNIGSGKSTILLAAEFALFGISTEVPGTALLRNGETTGSVELHCTVDDKEVHIKRRLKRGAGSVTQETGHIILNGEKNELTAVELKQKVLELLQYPTELLKKSKSTIFRYTVYAPQETMKEILEGKKENRLEILRRVFGIDKYKRIRNNAEICTTKLKQNAKELAIVTADCYEKEKVLQNQEKKKEELTMKKEENNQKVIILQQAVEEKRNTIKEIEGKIKEAHKIKEELASIQTAIEHKVSETTQHRGTMEKLQQEVTLLINELEALPPIKEDSEMLIQKAQEEITYHDKLLMQYQRDNAGLEGKKAHHEKVVADVTALTNCPICQQEVKEEHKGKVNNAAQTEMQQINQEQNVLSRSIQESEKTLATKKQSLQQLQEARTKHEMRKVKEEHALQKKSDLVDYENKVKNAKGEIAELQMRKVEIESKVIEQKSTEMLLEGKKEELQKKEEELKESEIEQVAVRTELNSLESTIRLLLEEVEKKKKQQQQITKIKGLQQWLETQFMNVMMVMEKKIMLRVHRELELFLQKWFTMFVDTETVKIRLDEEFTPIIEQNGYEVDYPFLSGGERTAAALAYRLALNQVINSLMTTIKTKELLILDEPTDGFSEEQLDRMRNILEELNTKQTILVSHDHKVESFVDHVIRVAKVDHTTKVLPH